MTKVQMAPGIPNEKSRTVRPVYGPATIHLPLQVHALPFREASVLSLQYTTVFPASLPDILGFPRAMRKFGSVSPPCPVLGLRARVRRHHSIGDGQCAERSVGVENRV